MTLMIYIFDDKDDNVSALKEIFKDLASITIQKVNRMLYSLPPPKCIDVLYLPLPITIERWGAKPLIHKSSVLPTTSQDQENGMPPFIVTGGCLDSGDLRGPIPELKLLLKEVLNAIRDFNAQNNVKLYRIGLWTFSLLEGVTFSELRNIFLETMPEL